MESNSSFHPVDTKTPLAQQEMNILAFWKENHIFEKSIDPTKPLFSFYDGPPFATGLPHYGHLLAGTIKDTIPRYKTMKGFSVPRRFGWDCHGLPVENEIEKSHCLSGAKSIEQYGIANFCEACRSIVLRYTEEWKYTVERMGRWVDFTKTYHTMDPSFMESVWWVFSELYKKSLVYKGFKVMPVSTKLGTPLSNFEATENYKEVDDPSVYILFPSDEDPNLFFAAWTTTPWTLLSNMALTVNEKEMYVEIQNNKTNQRLILAKERLFHVFPDLHEWDVIRECIGKDLLGRCYKPLFPFFSSLSEKGAFRVIGADFVQMNDGTGIVHTAPGFGEDDFAAAESHSIPLVCPVDMNGFFTDEVGPYTGRYVKDCDKEILRHLKGQGLVLKQEVLRHRYPFCWRSDTPLIYKAVSTWFVRVESMKEDLLKTNEQINWVPSHIKQGRFGKWLDNVRDWAISRNRYWGTPIPLWESADGEFLIIDSIKKLEELSGRKIDDLHRHCIDDIVIQKDGKTFKRIFEVFDCWFESGSMPYAQEHYPFEGKKQFENHFPADFIAEGLDQTRGWFYTLHVLSNALFKSPAFKNVVVNGIILAEDGNKMSKRLKNYPDPLEVVKKYGADAIRLYMLSSPAVRADDLCFSETGVERTLRQVLLPLWNAYSFFITYARIYNAQPKETLQPQLEIDRWILSRTSSLIQNVEEAMERYALDEAVQQFTPFLDELTNWYIRRNRRRFWSAEDTVERQEAFSTLYIALKACVRTLAPFAPFIADLIWMNLRLKEEPLSVHLTPFPSSSLLSRDLDLERAHTAAQTVSTLGHALRKEQKFKVRQPLARAFVAVTDPLWQKALLPVLETVRDELNVKQIELVFDDSHFVTYTIKPNFRTLGKKVGPRMKEVQEKLMKLGPSAIEHFASKGSYELQTSEGLLLIEKEDVVIERKVKEGILAQSDGLFTVAFDTIITEELAQEGLAREVVNKLNTMRREQDLDVSDRIRVLLDIDEKAQKMLESWLVYVAEETLATSLLFSKAPSGQEWDMNGFPAHITIEKDTQFQSRK
jgi:isoleucyl-tRNA synthetase